MFGRRKSRSRGSVPPQTGAPPPGTPAPPAPSAAAPIPGVPPSAPDPTQVRPGGAQPPAVAPPGAATPPGASAQPPLPAPPTPGTRSGPGAPPGPGTPPGLPPAPPAEEPTSLEALRAWVAQLDRKLGLRTYIVLAASLLALACSVVAVVLAIDARDNSASPNEVAALEERIAALETATTGTTAPVDPSIEAPEIGGGDVPSGETAAELDDLQDRVDDLLATDQATEQRITAIEQDIEDLRSELRRIDR